MKSNIKYCGALQKYTLSSDYPSYEIYLHIEDVDAIPIEWIKKWSMQNQSMNFGNGRNAIIKLFKDWEKENEAYRCR